MIYLICFIIHYGLLPLKTEHGRYSSTISYCRVTCQRLLLGIVKDNPQKTSVFYFVNFFAFANTADH